MNQAMLFKAFGDIKDDYIAEAYYRNAAEFSAKIKCGKKKKLAVFALAAALLIALGTAAYAALAGGELFEFFSAQQKKELSQGQQEYLNTQSVVVSNSVSEDGYTVTLESALCDSSALCLVVSIEAPEGIKVDFENDTGTLFFESIRLKSADSGNIRWSGTTTYPLPDIDEKENTARLVLMTLRDNSVEDSPGFINSEDWQISLGRLSTMTGQFYENWALLSESEFAFTTQLTEQRDELEMISTPVVCKAISGGEGQEKEAVDIEVTSFVLRPLSASCEFRVLSGGDALTTELLDVSLRLKDGSTVSLIPKTGSSTSDGSSVLYGLSAPLMLEDVESLILPESVVITRNES